MEAELPAYETSELRKLVVQIPLDARKQIAQMKLDLNRESMRDLVVEALNDLFVKHGYPPIA